MSSVTLLWPASAPRTSSCAFRISSAIAHFSVVADVSLQVRAVVCVVETE
jgi:hypothetical protein